MKLTRIVSGAAMLCACVAAQAGDANAQENRTSYLDTSMVAPSKTFELKLSSGYTQGFGNLASGRTIGDVAGAGIGVNLDADYRISPSASIGLESQFQEYSPHEASASNGLALNVGATYHAAPGSRGDPWVRVGTGYRLLWEIDPRNAVGTSNAYHGFTVATLKLGYDIRVAEEIAVAPIVAADLQTFLWKDADRYSSPTWSAFVYGGVQGRFDVMPGATGGAVVAAKR